MKRLYDRSSHVHATTTLPKIEHATLSKEQKFARKKVYEALVRAEEVYTQRYTFNTMIAGVMEAMNALNEQENSDVWTEGYWILLAILEPVVPHICWELSEQLFERCNFRPNTVIDEVFEVDTITLGLSVNGKRRSEMEVGVNETQAAIVNKAKTALEKWIEGKVIVKEIVVPNKLVNIVVKG